MGGHFWEYYTPHRKDVVTTLEGLRQREFAAGRFYLSHLRPGSITQARENTDATGTRSILDMEHVSDTPDCGTVTPLTHDQLIEVFGTDRPDRPTVERGVTDPNEALDDIVEAIERGEGRYVIIYEGVRPAEVYFCGYSYD